MKLVLINLPEIVPNCLFFRINVAVNSSQSKFPEFCVARCAAVQGWLVRLAEGIRREGEEDGAVDW